MSNDERAASAGSSLVGPRRGGRAALLVGIKCRRPAFHTVISRFLRNLRGLPSLLAWLGERHRILVRCRSGWNARSRSDGLKGRQSRGQSRLTSTTTRA